MGKIIVEKKRCVKLATAKGEEIHQAVLQGKLTWPQMWANTKVQVFSNDAEKHGMLFVQLGFVLRDERNNVAVYRRSERWTEGLSVLVSFSPDKPPDASFLEALRLAMGANTDEIGKCIGSVSLHRLGAGLTITKKKRQEREYLFIVFLADLKFLSTDRRLPDGGAPPEIDKFVDFLPPSEALSLLSAQVDPPNMDLAVLEFMLNRKLKFGGNGTSTVFWPGVPEGEISSKGFKGWLARTWSAFCSRFVTPKIEINPSININIGLINFGS